MKVNFISDTNIISQNIFYLIEYLFSMTFLNQI